MPYVAYLPSSGGDCIFGETNRFPLTYTMTLPVGLPAFVPASSIDPDDLAYAVYGYLHLRNCEGTNHTLKWACSTWTITHDGDNYLGFTFVDTLTDIDTSATSDFTFAMSRLGTEVLLEISMSNPIFDLRDDLSAGGARWRFDTVCLEAAAPWTKASFDALVFPDPTTFDLIELSNPTDSDPPSIVDAGTYGHSFTGSIWWLTTTRRFNPYSGPVI